MAVSDPTLLTAGGSSSSSDTSTTASISPTGGAIVLIAVGCRGNKDITLDSAESGFSIEGEWAVLANVGYDGATDASIGVLWAKAAATPGSGTIAATQSVASNRRSWVVVELTGQAASPIVQSDVGSGALSTLSIALSALASGSKALGFVCDVNGTGGGYITAGTNETELAEQDTPSSPFATTQVEYGADATVDWSTLSTTGHAAIAVEIGEAAGGGPTEVPLAGNQPAASGGLSFAASIALAGAQPAPSGDLDILDDKITIEGNQPAASGGFGAGAGTIVASYEDGSSDNGSFNSWRAQSFIPLHSVDLTSIEVKGYRVGVSGTLNVEIRTVNGDGPTDTIISTGTISVLNFTTLSTGSWAAVAMSSVRLAKGQSYAVVVQPFGFSTSLEWRWKTDSSGTYSDGAAYNDSDGAAPFTSTGGDRQFRVIGTTPAINYLISASGDQPAPSGALSFKVTADVAGNQPAPSGALSLAADIALAGEQPAGSGEVAAGLDAALAGDQPAATGEITAASVASVSGDQPAPSGSLGAHAFIALEGDQPAPSGSLTLVYVIALTGDQPAPSGAVAVLYAIVLAGSQPAASGGVTADVIAVVIAGVFVARHAPVTELSARHAPVTELSARNG